MRKPPIPVFFRCSSPEKLGYPDTGWIYEGGTKVLAAPAGTCPNPYRPKDGTPWRSAYALICCGKYMYCCVTNSKYGKCLLLNKGLAVPTINENINHGGKHFATEIFVHSGWKDSADGKWRGSMGCLTIIPDRWEEYMKHFTIGDKGFIIVTDDMKFDIHTERVI